ncbi:hypothetical protein L226DRAFT_533936, partial [Lentinus tigrinus ALCF2SS1-7]|uniref:uncharacterized protein n=1 Tax=Lentinus tigrinus ALCF2SS1-7 TaxID=1328758 RepID=UPI001165D9D1
MDIRHNYSDDASEEGQAPAAAAFSLFCRCTVVQYLWVGKLTAQKRLTAMYGGNATMPS